MLRLRKLSFFLCGLFLFSHAAHGQLGEERGAKTQEKLDLHPTDVIIWEAVGATREPDGGISVGMRLQTKQGFSIYKKNAKFAGPAGFELQSMEAPPTKRIVDPLEGDEVDVYDGGDFILKFIGLEPFQGTKFPVSITFLGCTTRICLFPYTQTFDLELSGVPSDSSLGAAASSLEASSGSSGNIDSNDAGAAESAASSILAQKERELAAQQPTDSADVQQDFADKLSRGELTLMLLLAVLFLGGMATNLTPCVFPMIPITVRILSSQGHRPVLSSSMYALGIVASYSVLGIVVAWTGGLFGALLASTTFNLIFAVLFFALAFSMLGFANLAKLQQVGLRFGTRYQSNWNTFVMGAGAGLVAAPCTGPILGALLAFSAKNPNSHVAWQFFVYSAGFALPYVFLGMSSQKLAKMKVPAAVQNGVKLAFAAIMFALSFYYLRIPFYGAMKSLAPYWGSVAMGAFVVGSILAWLAVTGVRSTQKIWQIMATLTLGVWLFASTQWLTASTASTIPLTMHKTVEEGLAAAKANQRPILIDGWAEWCEACKKMDATTFVDPSVREALNAGWNVVKLDFTEMNAENDALTVRFGMQGLPTLVLLPPDGDLGKMKKIVGYASAQKLLQEMEAFKGQ